MNRENKLDVTGDTGKIQGYEHAFTKDGEDLLTHIENGSLDEYLPHQMRLENTPPGEAFDPRPAYDFLSDVIKSGEKMHDYEYEMDKLDHQNKIAENDRMDEEIDAIGKTLQAVPSEDKVKEVIIFTSCDGYGKQAEYTRFGLDFEKLMNNIDKVLLLLPKVTIVVMSTFNIFSIFSYERLISKIYDLKLKHFNTERFWNSAIILDTSYLIPRIYYLEIKARTHTEEYFYQNVIQFEVVSID